MSLKVNFKTPLVVLLLSFTLFSCASKLPVYKVSKHQNTKTVSEKYDSDAKIGYTVSKDDSHLYISINTNDTPNQIKMLKNGVTVYFDPKGAKEQHTYIQYPIASEENTTPPDFESLRKDKTSFLNKEILKLEGEIQVVSNGKTSIINKELNTQDITVEVEAIEEELFYKLKLPISFLDSQNDELPSLGIEIKGIKKPPTAQGNSSGGRPSGGGRPAGVGGGRPAGVGGGRPAGVGGGRPSGNSSAQSPFAGLSNDIKIWFLLEINPKS